MANRDIVVIGGSAGGIQALQILVAGLPSDLQASVFVVVHISPWHDSALDRILNRGGNLEAVRARDGEKYEKGKIYVAGPDQHLLIENGRMVTVRGPKEHRNRPAIDPLFRSAALHCGSRTVGVLLSGMLDDGVSGLWQIKRSGGITIVQDPKNALQPQLPQSAIANVNIDFTVPISEAGRLVARIVGGRPQKATKIESSTRTRMNVEERIIKMEDGIGDIEKIAEPSQYTCPDCSGTLYELREGKLKRYRCRTGHAYGELTLMAGQRVNAEDSLWVAMRALREKSELLEQRANSKRNGDPNRKRLKRLARTADKQATMLRDMIETLEGEDLE